MKWYIPLFSVVSFIISAVSVDKLQLFATENFHIVEFQVFKIHRNAYKEISLSSVIRMVRGFADVRCTSVVSYELFCETHWHLWHGQWFGSHGIWPCILSSACSDCHYHHVLFQSLCKNGRRRLVGLGLLVCLHLAFHHLSCGNIY